ncbi:MAG TPA: hypothetical protein DCE56_06155 [Cyanobacteria bacterium UBA8553]|nr:hypothetical protein [Cyanobacteria bacterium UBA8553]HAJ61724.1 hypothetical protein [Cyanobacteria bacterium UBA8543]
MQKQLNDFISKLLPDHGIDFSQVNFHLKQQKISKGDYLFRERSLTLATTICIPMSASTSNLIAGFSGSEMRRL